MKNTGPITFIGEMGLPMTWGDPIDLLTGMFRSLKPWL